MSLLFVMASINIWLYNRKFMGENMVFYTKKRWQKKSSLKRDSFSQKCQE
jgi:hypothetical protein